ncbi:MAG: hypothetical protein JWQ42_4495 [Edaphobacter sp.]|nr:hypothetical protein [Edaphobacter sp.]
MRWENLRSLFGQRGDPWIDEVHSVEPRPLNEREAGWVRDILQVNDEWRDADVSQTKVVAEGWCGENGVSLSMILQAPEPENHNAKSERESVGNLWINTDDGSVINVQLSQFKDRLQEIYVLFVDTKNPKRKLPETWTEV